MIPRYTHPEMGRIWSDQRRYETWLLVETAAAEAMAAAGIVPAEAARDIRERGAFDIARIEEIEQTTQHDVIAFTTAVAEKVGPSARWLHFGMTSSDVIDTAQALQMREACDVILEGSRRRSRDAVRERALEHRAHADDRPHARRARRADDLRAEAGAVVRRDRARHRARPARARRSISVGKLSGAVGTFAHLPPSIEARRLPAPRPRAGAGRVAGDSARSPRRAAVGARDHRARRSRSSRSKSAACRRPRSARSRSRSRKGQKGSSAMPHKRNPIGCEQIVGLARLLRGNCHAALENVALWHERDISHSSVERVILPDSFIALDHMLRRFTRIVRGMVVLSRSDAREPEPLARRRVLRAPCCSSSRRRASRASRRTSGCSATRCGRSTSSATSRRCCSPTPTSSRVLSPAEIERAFDLDEQLQHVDDIFDRVFAASAHVAEGP